MSAFQIYPAIDLLEGRAVRLTKGLRDTAEVVGEPFALAAKFAASAMLHVVDLDGAFAGKLAQTDLVGQLAKVHPVQCGGGVRSLDDVTRLLDVGVQRVIIGTAILTAPQRLRILLLNQLRVRRFFNFELHGLDLLDAEADGIPATLVARQPDLRVPVADKLRALSATLDRLRLDYRFATLAQAAASV